MKIAIHHRQGSFSDYWIRYCRVNGIDYVLINCYSSNIINDIKGCDALLWNWVFWHSSDLLLAKQLIYSIEMTGIEVYPNSRTCQFYDDKLGQKYLSESLRLPLLNSHAFFSKHEALKWINSVKFPIVFKLRGGASSVNVKLVKNQKKGKKLIRKAFSRGFCSVDRVANFRDRVGKYKRQPTFKSFIHLLKGLIRIVYPDYHARLISREKGYVYFQDYVPDCKYDIRVVVVGERAFAMKRYTRKNDFRASGSGIKEFKKDSINLDCIRLGFEINETLKMQSVAFDFIESNNDLFMVEFSYTWAVDSFGMHPGYWKKDLTWVEGVFCPADFIIQDLLEVI